VLLLGLKQREPGGEPLLACSCPMIGHAFSLRRGITPVFYLAGCGFRRRS
jgi:hypothetical protein